MIERLKEKLLYLKAEDTVEEYGDVPLVTFTGDLWDNSPKPKHSIHAVSYRACYKAQLPEFFIDALTKKQDVVFDPFMGRGTTVIEAAFNQRYGIGCDVNPVNKILAGARLTPPNHEDFVRWTEEHEQVVFPNLYEFDYEYDMEAFYHPETLINICKAKKFLQVNCLDLPMVKWFALCVLSRISGPNVGALSGFTMPASQSVTLKAQQRINRNENRIPEYKDFWDIVRAKSKLLMNDFTSEQLKSYRWFGERSSTVLHNAEDEYPEQLYEKVQLVMTSPPFVDAIDYKTDNWLRGWFMGVDTQELPIWQDKSVEQWEERMRCSMSQLLPLVKSKGFCCYEVGEVNQGQLDLLCPLAKAGVRAGFRPVCVIINKQSFSKTAALYGVKNNEQGTNTNRILVFQKR